MNQHLDPWLASPHRHKESLRHDILGLAALQCPTDDAMRIEINDDSKAGEALARPDVGDVRDPEPPHRTVCRAYYR